MAWASVRECTLKKKGRERRFAARSRVERGGARRAAAVARCRRGGYSPMVRVMDRVRRLLVPALAATLVAPSVALAGPPKLQLQSATKCVALWNRSSPLGHRSVVLRLQPISALVAGASVPIAPGSHCSVLVMMSNGSWYASQTPCKTGSVKWSPLKRIPDDTAAQYTLAGGTNPFVHAARVMRGGTLALK
jgi:hypothetical protein